MKMAKLNKNKVGLATGIFFAILHAVWTLAVLVGVAGVYLNWILPLHFIELLIGVTTFNITNALILVVMAFIGGYVAGWFYALCWNWVAKK